jgi:D-glycero-D-manno-heptose 1,7-bisphosphate phosphatase
LSPRPAVFLDRDGTVVVDRHYLGDPAGVELVPGAAAAVRRLNRAGLPVLLVTNQSGIGRGYFTIADFERVQARLHSLLGEEGARIDATYHCPHAPGPGAGCECRKPAPGLFHRAAREHDVDLARSFFVGDRLRDVLPALATGGTGILVGAAPHAADGGALPPGIARVATLPAAVDRILAPSPHD